MEKHIVHKNRRFSDIEREARIDDIGKAVVEAVILTVSVIVGGAAIWLAHFI